MVKVVRLEVAGRKLGRGQSAKARKSESSAASEKERQRIAKLQARGSCFLLFPWRPARPLVSLCSFSLGSRRRRLRLPTHPQALFAEIDADGSGSVDADELEDALLAAGVEVNHDALVGMLNAVDEDGSGEIEFDEFCQIMEKLTGAAPETEWVVEKEGDVKVEFRQFGPGQFHSAAALDDAEHEEWPCKVFALEDTDLVVIAHADYVRVMESGFSGDLNKKAEQLCKVPMLRAALGSEHEGAFRQLAHIAEKRSFGRGREIAVQGHPATHLFVITEGECHVTLTQGKGGAAAGEAPAGGPAAQQPGSSTETQDRGRVHLPAKGPHSAQRLAGTARQAKKVELAALLAGDTFGEADALADGQGHGHGHGHPQHGADEHGFDAAARARGGAKAGPSGAGRGPQQQGQGHHTGRGAHTAHGHSRSHAMQNRHAHGGAGGQRPATHGGGVSAAGVKRGRNNVALVPSGGGAGAAGAHSASAGGRGTNTGPGDAHGHALHGLAGDGDGGDASLPVYSATLVAMSAVTVLALPRADLLRLGVHELGVMREYAAMRETWREQVVAERLLLASAVTTRPATAATMPALPSPAPPRDRRGSTMTVVPPKPTAAAADAPEGGAAEPRPRRNKLREAIGAKGTLPPGLWQPERPKFSSLGAAVGDLQRTVQPALTAGAQAFCTLRPDSQRGFVASDGKSFMRRPSTSNTDYALEQELGRVMLPGPFGMSVAYTAPPPSQPHVPGQHRPGAWVTPPLGPPRAPIPPRPYSALSREASRQRRLSHQQGGPSPRKERSGGGGAADSGGGAASSFFLTGARARACLSNPALFPYSTTACAPPPTRAESKLACSACAHPLPLRRRSPLRA